MSEPDPVDLIDLSDAEGNSCIVRVTSRFQPGILSGHDTLCADVLASASSVDARLELYLLQDDLAAWDLQLDQLDVGGNASIGGDRGLSLGFHLHEDRSVSVTVDDPDRLTVMMFLVMLLVGLTHRLTDVPTVLFGICRPTGSIATHAAGRVLVTS